VSLHDTIGNLDFDWAYQAAASGLRNASVAYPALAVSPGHKFAWTLPCLPSERTTKECHRGRMVVRTPDGIHVTAAGALRLGTAVAQPAVDAFRCSVAPAAHRWIRR
jgi:hypothetical protein